MEKKFECIRLRRKQFEETKKMRSGRILKFLGVDGFDVYNCSVPVMFEGKKYIFGRVEKHDEWARSNTMLFVEVEPYVYERVKKFEALPVEDPFITIIDGEFVLGGVHVVREYSLIKTYLTYFYRGQNLFDLRFFTSGPDYMKDIRLAELKSGKIAVLSRPRNEKIKFLFGTESQVGYAEIQSLDELGSRVIENAPYIKNMFNRDEWGGCNQAFFLENGIIGAIGHQCYNETRENGLIYPVYVNMAYVIDTKNSELIESKVIGTRNCFPPCKPKLNTLSDCAFTSGIVIENNKTELYSGLSDASEGVIEIENPFLKYEN